MLPDVQSRRVSSSSMRVAAAGHVTLHELCGGHVLPRSVKQLCQDGRCPSSNIGHLTQPVECLRMCTVHACIMYIYSIYAPSHEHDFIELST